MNKSLTGWERHEDEWMMTEFSFLVGTIPLMCW